jgi:tetratricopeptide (TPR) repeat protein
LNATAERILAQREPEQALEILRQSFDIDRRSCRTHLLAGYAFLDMNDTASAESFIQEALDLHPDYALALELMGNIRINQKDFSRAALLLTAANKNDPDSKRIEKAMQQALLWNEADSLLKAGWTIPTLRSE